ncbi:MAG: 1,4-dihydroxy-6-naphtoate synthase [Planctomycetes bacterium]|nr:1,4-dihydroxy-6-naphtoate synthase [Planctomycetota bacterium]
MKAVRTLRFGMSPCPNDTFLFHALLHGRVATPGVRFEPVIEDVESLNERMLRGELEVTKASFAAFARARETYAACRTGGALGRGNGPLVVASRPMKPHELGPLKIALPGGLTTAALLFGLFHPECSDTPSLRYDELPDAVANGRCDAAVIIHEHRFTYRERGLHAVEDLGQRWEALTRLPVPLGGVFVRRDVDAQLARSVERWIGESFAFARANPDASRDFVRKHAQELADGVTEQHIALYVNEFSAGYGKVGEDAIRRLLLTAAASGAAPRSATPVFVGDE